MAVQLGQNSNIYKYGSRQTIEYLFTDDNMFGIEVINGSLLKPDFDSNYLYVNMDAIIDPLSPLGKFIADGFIIKVGEDDEITSSGENNTMEVDEDLDNPIFLDYHPTSRTTAAIKEGSGFYKYRFHRPLLDLRYDENGKLIPDNEDALNENDCLNFGECSTAKHMDIEKHNVSAFPYKYQASVLESKETGVPFGVSDELNIQMLQNIPPNKKNDNAVPEPGECYATVRTELREYVMYHIGFCIYSHNGVNITLEANADNGREYLPAFGFYDRNPSGATFYKRYKHIYDNAETIVLKGRDINAILQEINDEITEQLNANTTNMDIGGRKTHNKNKNKKRTIKSKRKKLRSNSNKTNTHHVSKKRRKISSIRKQNKTKS